MANVFKPLLDSIDDIKGDMERVARELGQQRDRVVETAGAA